VRALITNDDGVGSPGLVTLAEAAAATGMEIVVAAPSWNSSGASSSLTGVEQDGRMLSRRSRLQGTSIEANAVDAAPAMITVAALRGGFGSLPTVVLSGVNCGRNTGHAVLHSGTVGAALTGYNHGARGMAISIDSNQPAHWETAGHVAEVVIRWLTTAGTNVVVNVNVPDVALADLRGLRVAPLARVGAVQSNITDTGEGYLRVTFEPPSAPEPGTDAALLADGWAVATPLRAVTEDIDADTTGLLLTRAASP
jgi:5'-nucleotidase